MPTQHEKAIVYLSVAELDSILQFHAEKAIDPPPGASYISMRNKGSGFRAVGDHFRNKYITEMGGEGVVGASQWREFDQEFITGDSYFFHSYAGNS